jgi:hypothetical protein
MRIGILPNLDPSAGGVYQYSFTMLRALHEWKEKGCEDEFVVFAAELLHPALVSLNGRHWTVKSLMPVQSPSLGQQTLNVTSDHR